MGIIKWILSWFGGGPLKSILSELRLARLDQLNAVSEQEKVKAKERVDTLTLVLADVSVARASAGSLPRWMAVIGFMIGFPFGLHVLLIGIGTSLQPLIFGTWLGDWLLHIPPWPTPLDSQEGAVIAFFFGGLAFVGGATAIAGAIGRRKG